MGTTDSAGVPLTEDLTEDLTGGDCDLTGELSTATDSATSELLAVSSNRLVFNESGSERGVPLCAVEPSTPITSLNKGLTFERNQQWFEAVHSGRQVLIVVGDCISDLKVAAGAPEGYSVMSVGIFNDTPHGPQPSLEEFEQHFDAVICGDDGSLTPICELVEGLEPRKMSM